MVNIVFRSRQNNKLSVHLYGTKLWECSALTVLHVTSHLEIDASGWRLAEQASANVSSSKMFFLVNSVYTNNVLNARVHV